jgi:hypothetical protein
MHRDKRQFRAIIFTAPRIDGPEAIVSCLPTSSRGEVEEFVSDDANVSLMHMYYLSEKEFSPGPLEDDLIIRKGKKRLYKWSMYYGHFRLRRRVFVYVAVPFSRMAEEVFGLVDAATKGIGRVYSVPDLNAIAKYIAGEQDNEERLIATGVRFQVTGDSDVNSLSLHGTDVLSSRTLNRATKELRGIGLVPKRVRMSHTTPSGKFGCECDTFGNFWFRVSGGGTSVLRLAPFIGLLGSNNLIGDDPSYPLRKAVRELEEESQNA